MSLKHTYQTSSTEASSSGSAGAAGIVGPAEWNADHTISGTSFQTLFNNGGSLTGMNGTSWDDPDSILTLFGGFSAFPSTGTFTKGQSVVQHAAGAPSQDNVGSGTGVGWNFNQIGVNDDGLDCSAFAVGSQNANGLTVAYFSNGTHSANSAIYGSYKMWGPPSTSATTPAILNFQAGNFIAIAGATMNGTDTGSGAKGAIFGLGCSVTASSAATNLLNVSGTEVGAGIQTGGSAKAFSVLSLANIPSHAVAGSVYDCVLAISAQSTFGSSAGILFTDYNGQHPVSTSGALIATQGSKTVATGIDFSSYTITGNFLNSGNFLVNGAGDVVSAGSNGFLLTGTGGFVTRDNNTSLMILAGGGHGTIFAAVPSGGVNANFLEVTAVTSGNGPQVQAVGTDTNININLVPKGSGTLNSTALIGQNSNPHVIGSIWVSSGVLMVSTG